MVRSTRRRWNGPRSGCTIADQTGNGSGSHRTGAPGLAMPGRHIIDLQTGDQPIANEDDRLHIVVNGESRTITTGDTGTRAVQGTGCARALPDSEIALHLYEELGTQCLHRLRGEFAFVLWDEPNQTLFAARDRFGIKPLFYAQHGGILMLASEAKALFAAGVPARWSRDAFVQCTSLLVPQQEASLFDGVHQVPPGHYLLATASDVRIVRYWDFDYPQTEPPPRSDGEYAEAFRRRIDESRPHPPTRRRFPVGCYLSGRIDSCQRSQMAARHQSDPIRVLRSLSIGPIRGAASRVR